MEIAFQGNTALGLCISGVYRSLIVITVAAIPLCAVIRPRSWEGANLEGADQAENKRTHTNPAKLMFAFLASHVAE
jgi:hypothetical protein